VFTRTFTANWDRSLFRPIRGRARAWPRPPRLAVVLAALIFPLSAAPAVTPRAEANVPTGRLVIMGGGTSPAWLHAKILRLAGGADARVLVVPFASAVNDGQATRTAFVTAGAKNVAVLRAGDPASALASVGAADAIWFNGGSQTALMAALSQLGIVEAIRERHRSGAVIGGTSAGAAVMSKVMIAGAPPRAGEIPPLGEGLGLWPETVIDQHFAQRNREPRLRATVQKHPKLVGVGIDESTFVVVAGNEIEIGGIGNVTVLDLRWGAELQRFQLRAGDRWNFRTPRK